MNLPKTIRIGPMDYRVQVVKNLKHRGKDIDGQVNNYLCLIRLEANLGLPVQVQTLWHEIIHAIGYQGRMNSLEFGDEKLVDPLAYALMQVVRDNPFLSKWGGG